MMDLSIFSDSVTSISNSNNVCFKLFAKIRVDLCSFSGLIFDRQTHVVAAVWFVKRIRPLKHRQFLNCDVEISRLKTYLLSIVSFSHTACLLRKDEAAFKAGVANLFFPKRQFYSSPVHIRHTNERLQNFIVKSSLSLIKKKGHRWKKISKFLPFLLKPSCSLKKRSSLEIRVQSATG